MPHKFSPPPQVEISPPSTVSYGFIQRLLAFYHGQDQSKAHLSPIWDGMYSNVLTTLVAALQNKQAATLAEHLGQLYATKHVWGMDASGGDFSQGVLTWFGDYWDSELLYTAVAAGVIPAYCPSQDNSQDFNRETVVADIERTVGVKLSHPGGCRMLGVHVGDRFIPAKMIECARTVISAYRLGLDIYCAAEIGAGMGFTAHLLAATGKVCHLIDLPVVSVIQAFLLSLAFGESGVWMEGELWRPNARIYIHGLTLPTTNVQLVINQNSMPEMPEADAVRYVKWIESSLLPDEVFLSINQETNSGGQKRVHDLVKANTDMRLVHRSPHFGRDGYVEEVFVKP